MSKTLKGMWGELRRRRVVSTAAGYLAVSFVLLQLGEILFPVFDLGPGVMRGLVLLLLTAFPIVLALSWVYDLRISGLERTDGATARGGPHRVLVAGVLGSALALAWAASWLVRTIDVASTPDVETSIGVLPFADMSASGDQGYLGDGLAEEILNILAGVDGLQVAARTSSFSFRENDDVREIGDRLNVATLLEGSVRRGDVDVRVTAQLIDTRTGFHIWSRTYDREVSDLLAVQDEIAQAISAELLEELGLPGATQGRYVADPEAQDAYWRGRAQWSRRDAIGIPEAIRLFNRAIEIDSMYAQAYAGLSDSWALFPQIAPSVAPDDALEQAEAFARRALALDEGLAEAHASLGLVSALRQDRLGALTALGRAVELNGSYAPALHWRANVLADMGRLGEAAEDAARAAAVDPLSPAIATDYGNILLWRGDLEGAEREFARAQQLDFGFAPAVFGSALVALQHEEDLPLRMALTQWAAVSGAPTSLAAGLAAGMLAFRRTGIEQPPPPELGALGRARVLTSGTVAALHGLLGARAGALRWLRTAVADRTWVDQYLRVNPAYDPLRTDPEFEEILRAVGA